MGLNDGEWGRWRYGGRGRKHVADCRLLSTQDAFVLYRQALYWLMYTLLIART